MPSPSNTAARFQGFHSNAVFAFGMKLRMKTAVAIVGGFVVVTMGVLTVALDGTEAHANVKIGGSGSTVTSTPTTTLMTASAAPAVKAPKPTA